MQAWQATVQDDRGNAIPNPVVSVYEADGTTLASVFNASGVAIANPVNGDIDGFVKVFLQPGSYKISGSGSVWDIVVDGVFNSYESAASGAQRVGTSVGEVKASIGGKLISWIRSEGGPCLGGGWVPSGDVYMEHFGGRPDPSFDCSAALTSAFSFGYVVNLRGGAVYYFNSTVAVPRRAQLLGPGASNADTLLVSGAPKLVFRGNNPSQSCFSKAAPSELFNHAKFQGFSLICEGSYSWMFDFGRCVQVSWVDISATATGMSTGGIRAVKSVSSDSAWLNQIERCNIILPTGSTARPLDMDWTDSVIHASSLSGGIGCREMGHGNKWTANNIERSSNAGLTLLKRTTNAASVFVGNFFDANAGYGVLIDVSQDTTTGRNVGHVFTANKFRTVHSVTGVSGIADIGYVNGTANVYTAGASFGNYHGVTTVAQYQMAESEWRGMVTGMGSNAASTAEPFTPDASKRAYFGYDGVNIPAGMVMARGSRTVYGMANVSGFFGANAGQGSGVQLGSFSSATPFIGASLDRNGDATDFRVYTGNVERIRVHSAGAWVRPGSDAEASLGTAANRWSQLFASNGTISTSDERLKQDIRDLSEAEYAVALRLRGMMRAYRMREAVAEKGEHARWHFGVIAQDVAEAFAEEGLYADDYGLFCRDEWEEQPEVLGDEGEVIERYRPAGERLSIRYDELMCFIISAL